MSILRSSAAALALTTALTPAAWAELTADSIWQQMQDYHTMDTANTLSFDSATRDGSTLTVKGLKVVSDQEESFGDDAFTTTTRSEIDMGDVRFVEIDEDTVAIEIAPVWMMSIESSSKMGDVEPRDTINMDVKITFDAPENIARQDGDAVIYTTTIGTLTAALEGPFVEDMVLTGANELVLKDVASTSRVAQGDKWDMSGDLTIGQAAGRMNMKPADEEGSISLALMIDALKGDLTAILPLKIDSENPAALFADDVKVDMSMSSGPVNVTLKGDTPDGPLDVQASESATAFNFNMGQGGISGQAMSTDVRVALAQFPELPFPLDFKAAETGYGFTMPLTKNTTGAPAALSLTMAGVEIPAVLWNMVDPGEQLPRGPLTVRAGLSGVIKLFADLYDDDAMMDAMMTEDGPALPVKARIDELLVEGVGVKLTGEGAVDFDENDRISFDGMPAPIGDVTLNASGTNGLINSLIAMGAIPEDQAMMTRMMLGMFTESTGDDQIRSHIEFKPGGQIFANGQQLR